MAADRTGYFGSKKIVLDTVSSTNDYAKGLSAIDGPHGTVVTAEEQTAGRGRFGRRWESSASKNLLFSVLLRPGFSQSDRIPLLPFAAAVGAAESIEAVTGLGVECKWPNDLLISKKKVDGMLLESSMTGNKIEKLVLGIGVNVNQTDFSTDMVPRPTSLLLESGIPVDRIVLLERMLEALEARYEQLVKGASADMLIAWTSRTTMFGTHVTVRGTSDILSGIAEGISDDGSLLLRTDNGLLHTVRAGDVTLGSQQLSA